MSQENYIAKLLEMEEAIIENVEKIDCFTYIRFHLPVHEAVCPHCGALTHRIHDYRVKILRDLPVQEKKKAMCSARWGCRRNRLTPRSGSVFRARIR